MNTREMMIYLVTDLDDCAYTIKGSRDDNLSQALVTHAKANAYNGFYVCTHRSYAGISLLKNYEIVNSIIQNHSPCHLYYDIINFPTYKIVDHFQNATGLQCVGVSTTDDILIGTLGSGFENLIKPYETSGRPAKPEQLYIPLSSILSYSWSKNPQLLQIAQHAAKLNTHSTVILDYFDDQPSFSEQADNLNDDHQLPDNVIIRAFHHHATSDSAAIKPINIECRQFQQRLFALPREANQHRVSENTPIKHLHLFP